MQKLWKTIPLLALGLVIAHLVLAPAWAEDADARKAKIEANLKLHYPQLAKMEMVMGDITSSDYDGLDAGSFTMNNKRVQQFLVAKDDTKLYMISGDPIDVSRSQDEIEGELAKRDEEERTKAAEKRKELDEAVAGLPMRGNPEAPVTIVEFSDFQCPYCSRGASTMEAVVKKYPNDVKFVFMNFPLAFHKWAKPAAVAAVCAGEQKGEAFWTLHDKYFEKQKELTPENIVAKSKEFVKDSGIDMAKFGTCIEDTESDAYKAAAKTVDDQMAFGSKMGVSGTPGFFVNGRFLNGAQPLTAFEPLIEQAKGD